METIVINTAIERGATIEIPIKGTLYRINISSVTDDRRAENDRVHQFPQVVSPVNA